MYLSLVVWIIFIQIRISTETGRGRIEFIDYHNPEFKAVGGECCETYKMSGCSSNDCDPYFIICVDVYPSSGGCKYGKAVTDAYPRTDHINFTAGDHIAGMANPLTFTIEKGVYLQLEALDSDDNNPDDSLGVIQETFTNISSNGSAPEAVTMTLSGGYISVNVVVTLSCDVFYFGDCSKYCKEEPGSHTCDSLGNMICIPGINCDAGEVETANSTTTAVYTSTTTAVYTSTTTGNITVTVVDEEKGMNIPVVAGVTCGGLILLIVIVTLVAVIIKKCNRAETFHLAPGIHHHRHR